MAETWKVIPFATRYEVSDKGRVRNRVTGKVKNIYISKRGYPSVYLCLVVNRGRETGMTQTVHMCMACAFLGHSLGSKLYVRHLDGDPMNRNISNLKIGTPAENEADKILHGTKVLGERSNFAILSSAQVLWAIEQVDSGRTMTAVAADLGVSRPCISNICSGENWNHLTGRTHKSKLPSRQPSSIKGSRDER